MKNLKLGKKEQYDIERQVIEKYNIIEGTLSPFTRLEVIAIGDKDDDIDIKKPADYEDIDIKKVSSASDEEIDIKKVSSTGDYEDIDIKKVKK